MAKLDQALITNDIAEIMCLLDADPELANRADPKGRTPIDLAVSRSNVEVVELLILRGAVINKREHVYGTFPMLQAVARNRREIVELLLQYGADKTMTDKKGVTAHDLAVSLDRTDIADILRD
jgi:ankyrin repeat protein